MLADDVAGGIALDVLRTGIPTDYAPARVEHDDGAIFYRIHHQAHPLFALTEGFFNPFARRQIAPDKNDRRKTDGRRDKTRDKGNRSHPVHVVARSMLTRGE